jgi:hypothetical protein
MKHKGMRLIKAAHIAGYSQPNQIGTYIPDVTGLDHGTLYIVECESTVGLEQQHTVDQWTAFFRYADANFGRFIAVVGQANAAEARKLLQQVAGTSNRAELWTF